jgi:hypothetical protein
MPDAARDERFRQVIEDDPGLPATFVAHERLIKDLILELRDHRQALRRARTEITRLEAEIQSARARARTRAR